MRAHPELLQRAGYSDTELMQRRQQRAGTADELSRQAFEAFGRGEFAQARQLIDPSRHPRRQGGGPVEEWDVFDAAASISDGQA